MSDDLTTRIILARHGEATYPADTEAQASGGILTEPGRDQAGELGYRLRTWNVAAVACSELSRAKQTAKIAADILGLEIDVRRGLHEYQLGDEPYNIQALGSTLVGWLAGNLQARALGGESGQEVAERISPVLNELVQLHTGKTVLVVIHGGAIIATLGSIAPGKTGLPTGGDPYNLETDIAGGASFTVENRAGSWKILPITTRD